MTAIFPTSAAVRGANPQIGRRLLARLIDDAILLGLAAGVAVAITTIVKRAAANPKPTLGDLYARNSPGPVDVPAIASPIMLGVLAVAIAAYYVHASAAEGRTLGRRALRLRIVRTDGSAAGWPVLFGRELLRTSLACLTLAMAWVVAQALRVAINTQIRLESEVDDLVDGTLRWLPFAIFAAFWIGAALADPRGRAPHDHAAGTVVVSAAALTGR